MRILLDLDEVLCDFVGGACKAFNADPELVLRFWTPGDWSCVNPIGRVKGFNITDEFFWAVIHERGERFWTDLLLLPWAYQVLDLVKSLTDDWHIISVPSRDPSSYSGKVKWLKEYFGKGFDRFALTPHKHIFAGPDTVLIDDKEQNVVDFIAAGGNGVLFPRHHNGLHLLKNDPVGHLRKMLSPKCNHVWVDPTNDRVEAGGYLVCVKCGLLSKGAPDAYQDAERELSLSDVGGGHPYRFDPDQAV